MFPAISRVVAVAMAGVVCFALLVPIALSRHQTWLAAAVIVVFVLYAAANVFLWRRLTRRA